MTADIDLIVNVEFSEKSDPDSQFKHKSSSGHTAVPLREIFFNLDENRRRMGIARDFLMSRPPDRGQSNAIRY